MPLDEAYLVWLYRQVGSVESRNKAKTYWSLLRLLYGKVFTWSDDTMEKDGNRAQDGKDLRLQFIQESGIKADDAWLDMPCSVLEMMVALCFKLAWDADGEPGDWFFILVSNIGLEDCTDANPPDKETLYHILDKVMARDYAANGHGGFFPLNKHKRRDEDQRDVELWYQAQAYILERI